MNRYFITGIGTDVGKTLVSVILTEALQADYWKPVQTGSLEGTDRTMVSALISNTTTVCFHEAYEFEKPVSPHIASAVENTPIHMEQIQLPVSKNKHLIIEGAGGLLVPLNDKHYVIELAKQLDAGVILVCRNYLGCINHSLLSIDYLLKNNYRIKGIVLNGAFDPLVKQSILNYADLPLLAEIGELSQLTRATVLEQAKKIDTALFK